MKKNFLLFTLLIALFILSGCAEERCIAYISPEDGNCSFNIVEQVDKQNGNWRSIYYMDQDSSYAQIESIKENKRSYRQYTSNDYQLKYSTIKKLFDRKEAYDKILGNYDGVNTYIYTPIYYKTVEISNTRVYLHDDRFNPKKYRLSADDKADYKDANKKGGARFYYEFYMPGEITSCKGVTSYSGNHAVIKFNPYHPPETIEIICSDKNQSNPVNPIVQKKEDEYQKTLDEFEERGGEVYEEVYPKIITEYYAYKDFFKYPDLKNMKFISDNKKNCEFVYSEGRYENSYFLIPSKDGLYKFTGQTQEGSNDVFYNIYVDTAPPVISGIKYGKSYSSVTLNFYDKLSGVDKVLLNGENASKGTIVNIPGKYRLVVYDKAGNSNIMKFTIK